MQIFENVQEWELFIVNLWLQYYDLKTPCSKHICSSQLMPFDLFMDI